MAIKIGTDCSGMEAPIQALRNLGLNFEHKFSCDVDKHARATIQANFPHGIMYDDIKKRENESAPDVDVYVAGFPCQPFSTAGKQQGFKDKLGRGEIFFDVCDFLAKRKPRVFVLENVWGLVRMKDEHGEQAYLNAILKELNDLHVYNIQWQVLNTNQHGIPHNRVRWYCVGIHKDFDDGSFRFPEPITCQSIELFLEERDPKLAAKGLPPRTQITAHNNVRKELKILQRAGKDPLKRSHIIDADSSPYRYKSMDGMSPCITTARAKGHWVTSRGRRMTKEEMMRLQGMNATAFKVAVSETQLGKQIGNTMSVNVLERILVRLLPAAQLAKSRDLEDRWESGKAIKQLAKTRGKGFMPLNKQIKQVKEVAAREGSPSPARVGRMRRSMLDGEMTPPRPAKRLRVNSQSSPSKKAPKSKGGVGHREVQEWVEAMRSANLAIGEIRSQLAANGYSKSRISQLCPL